MNNQTLIARLNELWLNGTISGWAYKEQIPSSSGNLVDTLDLNFPDGNMLSLRTTSIGCLENSGLVVPGERMYITSYEI